jgi:hypothetical protein
MLYVKTALYCVLSHGPAHGGELGCSSKTDYTDNTFGLTWLQIIVTLFSKK